MSTQIKQVRFFTARRHQLHKRKINKSLKGVSAQEIYERKQDSRARRAEEIDSNEELIRYIEWISELQRKSGLSNEAFARRIGVSSQTLKLWKRKSGHLPSERSFRSLCELERMLEIPVRIKDFKVRVLIRMIKNVSKPTLETT